MAEIKDKVITVESLKALHDYNEETYVNKTGDTVNGQLFIGNGSGIKTSDKWASYSYRDTDENIRCTLMLSDGNRFHINQQETGASYAERYLMPTIATDLTEDKWYGIITTKNREALFDAGATVLSSYQYGDELPAAGTKGRIFFKRLTDI